MSIAIPGKLTVIERNGSRGIFTVGELQTQIGAFQIKHRVLDQFPEGSYDGLFYLTRVYNQSNFAKGRIWVSLYADLDWEQLQIMAQNHVAEVSESLQMAGIAAEQEEETPPPVKPAAPAASVPADATEPPAHLMCGYCAGTGRRRLGRLDGKTGRHVVRQGGSYPA